MKKTVEEQVLQSKPDLGETPSPVEKPKEEEGTTEEILEETQDLTDLKKRAEVSSQNFERAKKAESKVKELEIELEEAKVSEEDDGEEYWDDKIEKKVKSLETELASFKETQTLQVLLSKYPALRDKQVEFDEFRNEYPQLELEKVAKVFLVENNLINANTERKGLEKATSGEKGAVKKGMSEEDVKRLRETQPRKYEKMLRDGRLNPDEIY